MTVKKKKSTPKQIIKTVLPPEEVLIRLVRTNSVILGKRLIEADNRRKNELAKFVGSLRCPKCMEGPYLSIAGNKFVCSYCGELSTFRAALKKNNEV